MHLSLYRKYRPQVFSDVVGQEHITSILEKEVEAGRIHHAYIFTGSRGTGKTTCAKILAKAVNCQSPKNGNPCLSCEMCQEIEEKSVMDIVEIDAASNTGVDNIRDLKEEAMFTPAKGKYRVFIIDEVHMLSQSAFNALLKILEEPPEHVLFILATTEVDAVIPTVLSRCQRFDFKRIPVGKIAERLQYVSEKEGFSLTDDGAEMIAKISDGALRDALSLLEQASVYSENIDRETVLKAAGIAGRGYLFEMLGYIKENDISSAIRLLNSLYENGKDLSKFLNELAFLLRDAMLLKCSDKCKDLLNCMPDEISLLEEFQKGVSIDFILSKLDILEKGLNGIEKSFNARVYAELVVIKLCKEEEAPKEIKKVPPTPKKVEEKPQVEKKEEKREAPKQTEASSMKKWAEIKAELSRKNPMLASFLEESQAKTDGQFLYISTENEFFHKMIRTGDNGKILIDAAEAVTGERYKLKVSAAKKEAPQNAALNALLAEAEKEGIKVNRD